jgi:hypothetical protein
VPQGSIHCKEIPWLLCHKARSTIRNSPGAVTSHTPQLGNPVAGVPQTSSGHVACMYVACRDVACVMDRGGWREDDGLEHCSLLRHFACQVAEIQATAQRM